MGLQDTKCNFCDKTFDGQKGESAQLCKMRNGEVVFDKEICPECYKKFSKFIREEFGK